VCFDCNASRICTGKYRLYSPSCAYCGARLIQQIPAHSGTTAEASQRRKAALLVWTGMGHDEKAIRELVAGPLAYEPITKEKK
jgi:hypothetical protein